MRAFSYSKDTKRFQWGSRTPGLKMVRTLSTGVVWGMLMLAISLGSGCGKGGDGGNSAGTSSRDADEHAVTAVQGDIDPKWPSDKLPKSVPPIAGAKVLRSMQDGDDFGVVYVCKKSAIETYVQQLEQGGWSIDEDMGSDGNDELGAISRFVSNDAGEHLQLFWHGGNGTLGYSKK